LKSRRGNPKKICTRASSITAFLIGKVKVLKRNPTQKHYLMIRVWDGKKSIPLIIRVWGRVIISITLTFFILIPGM
jgi:hypothetical protein